MRKRMKEILRDRRASSFPMTIGIVLSLIILMCGISEYFRLQIIAAGVREAVEDAVISTVNDNYAGVYHGVREGYSGSYVPFGEGSWEEDLNEGDIYDYLDETIGTRLSGGRHIKYADTGTAMEFAIDSLQVTLRNAPLVPHKVRTNFLSNLLVLCSKQHPRLTCKVPLHFFHLVKAAIQSLSKTVFLC